VLDRVVVKEDEDLRGRAEGEVAELVIQGLRAAGMHGDQIEVVRSEREAVERTMAGLGEGDLAVVLVDDVPGILSLLRPYARTV
jgi:cyanophycin synthetase